MLSGSGENRRGNRVPPPSVPMCQVHHAAQMLSRGLMKWGRSYLSRGPERGWTGVDLKICSNLFQLQVEEGEKKTWQGWPGQGGGQCPACAHTWAEMAGTGALHKPCPGCARPLKGRCLRRCSMTLVALLAGVFAGFSEQVCLQVLLSWHGHSSTDSFSLIRVKIAFPGGASGKNSPLQFRRHNCPRVQSLGGEDPSE